MLCVLYVSQNKDRSNPFAFFERFIEKKVCTACPRTNYKIVPLTNLNEYLHNGKSGIKANINTSSEKVQNITANCIHIHY